VSRGARLLRKLTSPRGQDQARSRVCRNARCPLIANFIFADNARWASSQAYGCIPRLPQHRLETFPFQGQLLQPLAQPFRCVVEVVVLQSNYHAPCVVFPGSTQTFILTEICRERYAGTMCTLIVRRSQIQYYLLPFNPKRAH
jgi:hypothetical protein